MAINTTTENTAYHLATVFGPTLEGIAGVLTVTSEAEVPEDPGGFSPALRTTINASSTSEIRNE